MGATMRYPSGLIVVLLLTGCASGLQYKPDKPVPGARVSADYTALESQVLVDIDTDGYRLERAGIVLPDGSQVQPENVVHAPVRGGGDVGIGVGVGGGSGGFGGGIGVGTTAGRSRARGFTSVYFNRQAIGEPPWTLEVKLVSLPSTTITLPAR